MHYQRPDRILATAGPTIGGSERDASFICLELAGFVSPAATNRGLRRVCALMHALCFGDGTF